MLNKCVNDKTIKDIQKLLQQSFSSGFVHPHPFNDLVRSELPKLKSLDGLVFDPRFLFTTVLVSRWFARACMLEDHATTNNQAHLLLYGDAGTGKTLLTSVIASAVPTYKFITGSKF